MYGTNLKRFHWLPAELLAQKLATSEAVRDAKQLERLAQAEVDNVIWAKIAEVFPGDTTWLSYDVDWGWECPTSPIGVCVYDTLEDPCQDDCLFCHEPEERK